MHASAAIRDASITENAPFCRSVFSIEPPGANLLILESVEVATSKIGVYNQWIHVRDKAARAGYVAAWYVEEGPTVEGKEEPEEPPEPEVEPEPEVPVPPVPVEEPVSESEGEKLTIYVSDSVGPSGLRLRKTASLGGALVAIEKAGTALTVLEPAEKARPKIGKEGKWIHVSDPKRLQGYVAANYVESQREPAPAAPIPEPTSDLLTVYVNESAAAGLRMRSGPQIGTETLKILQPKTALTVLEGDESMVGAFQKWLKVRDPEGDEGYVAAWYVRK